jgi:V8-like Glu-specific endopeptidase
MLTIKILIFIIFLLFLFSKQCDAFLIREKRIVDTHDVAYKDHRYMAFLVTQFERKGSKQGCSGTIISDRVILTAAHCVYQEGHE